MQNCIVITGQTATGKTATALKLAKKIDGELINCDSRQLYKDIDIISGKDIDKNSRYVEVAKDDFSIGFYMVDGIKIWLYDCANVDTVVSSYEYKKLVKSLLTDYFDKKKTPIFVGGTHLYIKSLLYGFETETIPPKEELRTLLNDVSVAELQSVLKKIDLESFEKLNNSDANNPHRLIRRIEIAQYLKEHTIETTEPLVKATEYIGYKHANNQLLTERIKKRVEERLNQGAVEEIIELHKKNYPPTSIGLTAIGCKQIIGYLAKEYSYSDMIAKWVESEVAYAKRQLQFMKTDKQIKWHTV